MKKIKKLNIDLFEGVTEEKYNEERSKYIAEYTVWVDGHSTGFFGYVSGREVHRPDVGEAKWNEYYPHGFDSWATNQTSLNAKGEQDLINKVNELVEAINALAHNNK